MKKNRKDYIQSTLDVNDIAFLIESISVDKLIIGYKNQFGINIQKYFKSNTDIKIYECKNTNYRFFYPFNIDGDGEFYECLQKVDWYYMPWKWEHDVTKKKLVGNEKILEIGSGGLGFVENLFKSGYDITGLELNKESIFKANKIGLNVLSETVQTHAIYNFEKYDLVCSYQVLEHIAEVNLFIQAQVDCLKKGGKLIISVPNNDSFIKLTKGGLLNFPPHHMGLWNKKSLISLGKLFDLKVVEVLYEPLQEYHLNWYIDSMIQNFINKNKMIKYIFFKMNLLLIYTQLVKRFKSKIHGHTIMVIYTKI